MDTKFITDLLWGVFFSYYSIFTWIGLASSIFLLFPRLEGAMKDKLANARPYAVSILLAFILISTILTSYSIYEKKQTLNIDTTNARPVTKQEIRTFLEQVNQEILKTADARKAKIQVMISIPTQIKLAEISKRPDFDRFLSIRKTGGRCIGGMPEPGLIKESGENGYMDEYEIYPKDALIERGN